VPVHADTYKVHTDRGNVGLYISVIGEPQHQRGLASPGVAYNQYLEQKTLDGKLVVDGRHMIGILTLGRGQSSVYNAGDVNRK